MNVRIYVEGGFEGGTKSNCRKGFRVFFEKVLPNGSFTVIASGDRAAAFHDFCQALEDRPGERIILLVDSEAPVSAPPWKHLEERQSDLWKRPKGVTDDQAHLMVQVMEAWFLADHQMLAEFYGQGFLPNSLPHQPDIEKIGKEEVYKKLRHATKNTQKGTYHKTRHGFELLEQLNPSLLRRASAHAESLLSFLERETTVSG